MIVLKTILRHRRFIFFLHIFIALAALPGVFLLKTDNSPEIFFAQDHEALKQYHEFLENFGNSRSVRIVLRGKGLWTHAGLKWLSNLEEQVSEIPGVEAVAGLAAWHKWHLIEWPPRDLDAFRREIIKNGFDRASGLISIDGNTMLMLVVFADLPVYEEKILIKELNRLFSSAPLAIQAHLTGMPIIHSEMDRSLARMASVFLPLLFLMTSGLLLLILRRIRYAAAPLIFTVIVNTILFGGLGYSGAHFNLVNIIIAPLLFVINIATCIHILIYFQSLESKKLNKLELVLEVYRNKTRPILWTGLTTFIAFGSLITGIIQPIRTLGLWSACGIGLSMVLIFTLYPVLLMGLKVNIKKERNVFNAWASSRGKIWADWVVLHRFSVLAVTVATLAFCIVGLTKLKVNDNIGRYFSADHPMRVELERLEHDGLGVFAAELVLSFTDPENKEAVDLPNFQNPEAQQKLSHLSSELRKMEEVYGTLSSGDILEAALRFLLVEGERSLNTRWMALGLIQSIPSSRRLLYSFMTEDGATARITLLFPMLNHNQIDPVFQCIQRTSSSFFPNARIWITGQFPLILLAQKTLLRGLLLSLSITLLCIIIIFVFILKYVGLAFRILIPNVWPVIVVLGVMGWLKIGLDSASVMTGSVVLGLAVDDTLHTLAYFLHKIKYSKSQTAIVGTLKKTAPAHILTSLILCCGFLACFFSDLQPVSRMGILSASAIFLALMGDLFLIPALFSVRRNNYTCLS